MRSRALSDPQPIVHLVDGEATTRNSTSFLLRAIGYSVRAYASGEELLGAPRLDRGCILLDLALPGSNGNSMQQSLHNRRIDLPVIVMTGSGDIPNAVNAMKAGALDFIEKPFRKSSLVEAMEKAFADLGDRARLGDISDEAMKRVAALTPRERDILQGLARGLANKVIAHQLGISPRTAEIHRAHMMTKLGAPSLAHALRTAFAAGLGDATTLTDSPPPPTH